MSTMSTTLVTSSTLGAAPTAAAKSITGKMSSTGSGHTSRKKLIGLVALVVLVIVAAVIGLAYYNQKRIAENKKPIISKNLVPEKVNRPAMKVFNLARKQAVNA